MVIDKSNYTESVSRLRELETLIENGEDELEDYIEANGLDYAIRLYDEQEESDGYSPYE
jgi:hypothetical protein